MENILVMANGYEMTTKQLENIRGGKPMERSIKLNNDTFELSIPQEKSSKLTIIFKSAKSQVEKAFLMQEVERDLEKAKVLYSYGSYVG